MRELILFGIGIIFSQTISAQLIKTNIEPELVNSIAQIKLGSNVSEYPFIKAKTELNKKVFQPYIDGKKFMFNFEKTHYVDLNEYSYKTYGNQKILGIFLGTVDAKIYEIQVVLDYDNRFYQNLLLNFRKPDFYGKGEYPDDITNWDEPNFSYYILSVHMNKQTNQKYFYSIQITDIELQKRFEEVKGY